MKLILTAALVAVISTSAQSAVLYSQYYKDSYQSSTYSDKKYHSVDYHQCKQVAEAKDSDWVESTFNMDLIFFEIFTANNGKQYSYASGWDKSSGESSSVRLECHT